VTHRSFRLILAAALAGSLTLIAATLSQAAGSAQCERHVCFQGAVVSGQRVRPAALFLSATGAFQVIDVHWTGWDGEIARGSGTAVYESISGGKTAILHRPVTVYLAGTVACDHTRDVPNGLYYDRVKLVTRSGTLLAGSQLRAISWAPCNRVPEAP
jgi:hypothetical protein